MALRPSSKAAIIGAVVLAGVSAQGAKAQPLDLSPDGVGAATERTLNKLDAKVRWVGPAAANAINEQLQAFVSQEKRWLGDGTALRSVQADPYGAVQTNIATVADSTLAAMRRFGESGRSLAYDYLKMADTVQGMIDKIYAPPTVKPGPGTVAPAKLSPS